MTEGLLIARIALISDEPCWFHLRSEVGCHPSSIDHCLVWKSREGTFVMVSGSLG